MMKSWKDIIWNRMARKGVVLSPSAIADLELLINEAITKVHNDCLSKLHSLRDNLRFTDDDRRGILAEAILRVQEVK